MLSQCTYFVKQRTEDREKSVGEGGGRERGKRGRYKEKERTKEKIERKPGRKFQEEKDSEGEQEGGRNPILKFRPIRIGTSSHSLVPIQYTQGNGK